MYERAEGVVVEGACPGCCRSGVRLLGWWTGGPPVISRVKIAVVLSDTGVYWGG